jgi:hypothetical protein
MLKEKKKLTQEVFEGKDPSIVVACVDYDGMLKFGDSTDIRSTWSSGRWRGANWLEKVKSSEYEAMTMIKRSINLDYVELVTDGTKPTLTAVDPTFFDITLGMSKPVITITNDGEIIWHKEDGDVSIEDKKDIALAFKAFLDSESITSYKSVNQVRTSIKNILRKIQNKTVITENAVEDILRITGFYRR